MKEKIYHNPVARAYLLTRLLSFPFWGMFTLLPMILAKDLHVGAFQIATIIALKPLTALFSSYFSHLQYIKKIHLTSSLLWGNIFLYLPFLFFPLITSSWLIIFSFGLFMFFLRSQYAPWMEILKMNLPEHRVSKICSLGLTIEYLGATLLPFLFGWTLDHFSESWRWIFPVTAFLGILSSIFIADIPQKKRLDFTLPYPEEAKKNASSFNSFKSAKELLLARPDFLRFQIGFFLGGAGLIIMQSVLPQFFTETLHLSYTRILLAIATFKGLGFVLSSSFWVKILNKSKIFIVCSYVTCFAMLFPLFLFLSPLDIIFVYLGYFFYGVMQGGSELSWKMSGPIFSKHANSSPYTLVNVLSVGVRGIIFPYFGFLLYTLGGSYFALSLGAIFCLFATIYLRIAHKKYSLLFLEK